ncbi:hypothetical protein AXG93_434s1000 [Marchantia polymorpha subsp. ruderalis]|uniref:Uncharacterized protein n=1 Tax=Marchantia polymorpha subsp. ruderalis TaxID=1480154 RepID=A0A176VYN4_MARPO|nr:hypothetical protein AXG93_434s1000 [Marchantia polymorpha subsp. ruderalis]
MTFEFVHVGGDLIRNSTVMKAAARGQVPTWKRRGRAVWHLEGAAGGRVPRHEMRMSHHDEELCAVIARMALAGDGVVLGLGSRTSTVSRKDVSTIIAKPVVKSVAHADSKLVIVRGRVYTTANVESSGKGTDSESLVTQSGSIGSSGQSCANYQEKGSPGVKCRKVQKRRILLRKSYVRIARGKARQRENNGKAAADGEGKGPLRDRKRATGRRAGKDKDNSESEEELAFDGMEEEIPRQNLLNSAPITTYTARPTLVIDHAIAADKVVHAGSL